MSDSPEIPTVEDITSSLENLADLTAEQLTQLDADIRARYETDRNAEVVNLDDLEVMLAGLDRVTERRTELAAEQAAAEARLAELDARISGDAEEVVLSAEDAAAFDGWSDDELAAVNGWDADQFAALAATVTDEPEAEAPAEEPEGSNVAASQPRTVLVRQPVQPEPVDPEVVVPDAVIARTGNPGSRTDVYNELHAAAGRLARLNRGRDGRTEIGVASIPASADLPRPMAGETFEQFFDRQLAGLREFREQMHSAGNVRQASGTLCAPPFVDYALFVLGSEAQPIGGMFPRGGGVGADAMKTWRYFQAFTFDDVTDVTTDTTWGTAGGGATADTVGIGSATATQNALALDNASSPYPKLAMRANCLDYVDCEQRAAWLEIVFDNLGSMAWPEFVAAIDRAGRIALANYLDELRLEDWYQEAAARGSVITSIDQPVNANQNYLRTVLNIVETDRSDKRDWDTPYVVAQPRWADAALVQEVLGTAAIAAGDRAIDEARQQIFRDYRISFTNYLSRFGVTSAAYLTEFGYPTKLDALPADGDAPQMPCQFRVGIARDDAGFVRVGDELNLGVLRTETDLENNDWRTFYETWTRLCFRVPPIVADINVNPNMLVEGYNHNPQATAIDWCQGSGS